MNFLTFRRTTRSAVACLPLLLVGCANQGITHSGFLHDDGRLEPVPGDARSLVFARPESPPASFRSSEYVVVDPVELRLPAEQAAAIPSEVQAQARADFHVALQAAFAKRYIVVAQSPVDGALRVRAAITGLKPSNPALNAITLLVIGPVSNGGVSTEAEVVDGVTGERLAAQATFTNGHLFNGGIGGYFVALGHVRKAFETHADKLCDLTSAHADQARAATPQTTHRASR